MRRILALFAVSVLLAMTGCASHVPSSPPSGGKISAPRTYDPKTKPYTVLGRTYYPLQSAAGYDEVGLASWYGSDFHGNKTADGRTYNMYGISAAHKTLPLGTRVRVTNLENDRSVELTINDRGPFVRGRILDLSYGAAKRLGTVERGVAKVRITALGAAPGAKRVQVVKSAIKYYHVRVGAFAVRDNAERTHRRLVAAGYTGAVINTVNRDGQILHIVQAGSFVSRDKAEAVQLRLKSQFPTCYIVS
ncbi:septal ring lytic transglycosylase RlpA family protein [Pseudodesulfovibrio cashew]|uniref:Probable endolytic peptidoglycan transglycosylase RlpA n=1 Tax=Pseudodesulfovibrio cashew TaxID=2678688 RepID=A0A6I6JET0_9BACT|nr:septal ring lytic transglycosylase RlpA family protein [Pseudodesulfovibrio cashew]QGY40661.1 septal ring lytic transglycosylase RlpA family protein [Pseudodesulfovibrio cashew]